MATWTDSLSLGIETLDHQHRELLDNLDALQAAVRQGKGAKAALPTLRFLIEYADKHFAEEEKLMSANGYPDLPSHRGLHEHFRKDCVSLLGRLSDENEASKLSIDLCFRLTEWLHSHIARIDKEMGKFLAERGVG